MDSPKSSVLWSNRQERLALANHATHSWILEELLKEGCALTRTLVAKNPNLPWQLLDSLVVDSSSKVRRQVASLSFTQDILGILKDDISVAVRLTVLNNPQTPKRIIRELSHDDHERVRESALWKIENS